MAQSIELDDIVMSFVRTVAEIQGRSVSQQAAHWLHIGRAIEHSAYFDHNKVNAALEGELAPSALSELEMVVWLDCFTEMMANPGPWEEAHFARRQQLGLGVGLDDAGNLIRSKD